MVVGGIEDRLGQASLDVGDQGAHEDPLGRLRRSTVARTGTAKAARVADIYPVGGTVDGCVATSSSQSPERDALSRCHGSPEVIHNQASATHKFR